MTETASYSLVGGGFLFCTLAVAADVLTLTMPRRHWRPVAPPLTGRDPGRPAVVAGAAVTVVNLAGYVGEHLEQYQAGRETMATVRSMAMERLGRLRDERKAIVETRPPAVIAAALNDARRPNALRCGKPWQWQGGGTLSMSSWRRSSNSLARSRRSRPLTHRPRC